MAKLAVPRTKQQKGRMWATATLVICGTFSVWANVRSGVLHADSVVVSVLPPVVAFLSSHLISYFNPTTKWTKATVYGGFGLICIFAMYGSGWHIVDFVSKAGQHWTTAIIYVFITDGPMLLSAGILIEKVSTSRTVTKTANQTSATKPAKSTTAAKTTKPPVTRAIAAKSTKPANAPKAVPTFKAAIVDEMADAA